MMSLRSLKNGEPMSKKYFLSTFLLLSFVFSPYYKIYSQETVSPNNNSSSTEKKVNFTIRMGQGGFKDARSDIDKLGGGQVALDIKLTKYPIAISFSGEYYTNSADPTHSYEIAGLFAVNLLYMKRPFKTERVNFFAGGGLGSLDVPKDGSDAMEKGIVYNLEGGINVRTFWKIGFYGIYKYLYANKEVDNVEVIDFNEHIVLLGITFNFGF